MKDKKSTNNTKARATKTTTKTAATTTSRDFQPHTDIFVSTGLMQKGQVK